MATVLREKDSSLCLFGFFLATPDTLKVNKTEELANLKFLLGVISKSRIRMEMNLLNRHLTAI